MIQKMQKTVEILQVQFIDKVVEISETMQNKDKCQRSRRNGNSWKLTDRIVDVPVVLKRQCQPSAQVPTDRRQGCKAAERSDRQSAIDQTPSAKTRFTRKSRERQPTKRRHECLKHERERAVRLHQMCRPISAHISESGVPADHDA